MNRILCRQLALDYCCTKKDVTDDKDHFNIYKERKGSRKYAKAEDCPIRIAVINGKVLFSGRPDLLLWCKESFNRGSGEWFFEAENMYKLDIRLRSEGYSIRFVHPFYICETISYVRADGFDVQWFEDGEIERFRGDDRFDEAFAFNEEMPDMIGVAAVISGKIIGMAGASCDSPTMWQIGINVDPSARGMGVGKTLVGLLKNEILRRGKLPFYGTGISHIVSQRLALSAGFVPAWTELSVKRA